LPVDGWTTPELFLQYLSLVIRNNLKEEQYKVYHDYDLSDVWKKNIDLMTGVLQ
jgi:hypothetical protein